MEYKNYTRREILDKAEYYRSIGKKKEQRKLEDYVKAVDYGTDGFGVPYKTISESELKRLMEANPEPEKLPTAAKSDKTDAIDVEVVSSAPSSALTIAESLRKNQIKQKEKPQLALPPAKTPLALPPARQLALPPAKEEPPKPTSIESDEDWEGNPMDHRDIPWAKRGIDDLRDQIDKDPNIPFGDDKIPYEDDITQILKDRDKSMDEDEKENAIQPEVLLDGDSRGDNAKPLPTANGKKQRRKTKGKPKINLGRKMPKKSTGGLTGGLKEIADNINDARQALFDFYKVQKDRFKLRKKLDKQLATRRDALKDERALEGVSTDDEGKKDNVTKPDIREQSKLEKGILDVGATALSVMLLPLIVKGMRPLFSELSDDLEKQEVEEPDTKEEEQLADDFEKDTNELKKQEEKVEEGEEGGKETTTEAQNTEETTVTNVESSQTQDTNLESNTSTMETNVSNEQQSEQEEIPAFAEGGKITPTPTQAPSQGNKTSGVMSPPKTNSNTRQGLQQLSIKDLSTKGTKALSTFVKPIKSVFKLPNIVAKKTLNIGKSVLNPVSKIAGKAFKMTPMGMGMSILKSMKGDKGDKGEEGLSNSTGDSNYFHPDDGVIRGYRNLNNLTYSNNYSNSNNKTSNVNSTTNSSFGNNILTDIKNRGISGVAGGIADMFTSNLFDFDGKNLKPEKKNSMIDKGESVTTKMVDALNRVNARQVSMNITKNNSGKGKTSQISSAPSSKSSKTSRDTSLQPSL